MHIKVVAGTSIGCRNHERLPIYAKADVADESLIQDSIGGLAIVNPTLRFPGDSCACGWARRRSHSCAPAVVKDVRMLTGANKRASELPEARVLTALCHLRSVIWALSS